ncbi:MAG: hypothetical protein ACHQUC_07290 [Chlamydiales bacterium]
MSGLLVCHSLEAINLYDDDSPTSRLAGLTPIFEEGFSSGGCSKGG